MEKNEQTIKNILATLEILKAKRSNFESLWQEVADYVLPRKARFTYQKTNGARQTDKIYETTALYCAELLASCIQGYLTNPATEWFKLKIKGADKAIRENKALNDWLEEATEILRQEFDRPIACFATNIHEVWLDLITLGTAGLFLGWNEKEDCLLFQSRFLGELYLDEDENGSVDTVYRVFTWDLRKIINFFGEDCLPQEIKEEMNIPTKRAKEYEIIQAIYPNPKFNPEKLHKKDNRPLSSIYVLRKSGKSNGGHILLISGYEEPALFTPRWLKSTGEVYGRSPALNCLPDIKMLQEMMKETLISAQLANRPPVITYDDDSFSPLATYPGGIIYARKGQEPTAFNAGVKPQISIEMMNEIRERIQKGFYLDRTMLAQGPQATATEILKIVEEKLRSMGPILGRMQSEILGPMITRAFNLLLRRGKIAQPPKIELEESTEALDLEVAVEYVSPLAMAQRQQVAENIAWALANSAGLFELSAGAAQNIDADKGIRDIWEMFGVGNILRNANEVEKLRKQEELARQEATQQQEAMASLQLAGAAKEVNNAV